MNPAMTTTTTPPPPPEPVRAAVTTHCDINVIESLKKYNQSQIEKVLCIENDTSALDCDVVGEATTHENDMPELPEAAAAIAKTVMLLYCVVYFIFMPLPCLALPCQFEYTSMFAAKKYLIVVNVCTYSYSLVIVNF